MSIFERKCHVGIKDIGSLGLMTNEGFLDLLENTACIHSEVAGYGVNQMEQTHLSWVLLHWKVHILKRVPFHTAITIKTWAKAANKCLTYRDFEMYDENNELLGVASTKWSLVDTQTGRIARITPEIIDCYSPEDSRNVFEEVDIPKLREPETIEGSSPNYVFTVSRRDIDMNKHMHNLYYLDYAIEALPEEVYQNLNSNEFEIMYKNGAKLGETVNCFYVREENTHTVVMKNAQDNRLHAIIQLKS